LQYPKTHTKTQHCPQTQRTARGSGPAKTAPSQDRCSAKAAGPHGGAGASAPPSLLYPRASDVCGYHYSLCWHSLSEAFQDFLSQWHDLPTALNRNLA